MSVRRGRLLDLGLTDFRTAWHRQLDLVEERKRGEGQDTLILVEHPHVITLGRRRSSADNVLAAGDVPVVEIERGGDVTYHGPGQLVAYPIVLLQEGERDLHRFLRNLEEAVILLLTELGVPGATRNPGATGVWVDGRKLASIGIACRRWVTFHGVAVNLCTDLSYFARMNPCGFEASVMSSATQLAGRKITVDDAKASFARHLGAALGRDFA